MSDFYILWEWKDFKLHNWMSMQLSKELRNIIDVQWINKWDAWNKCKHIAENSHFIDFLSFLQCKSDWKVQSSENQN